MSFIGDIMGVATGGIFGGGGGGGGGGSTTPNIEPYDQQTANLNLAQTISGIVQPGATPTSPQALQQRIMGMPGTQFLLGQTTDEILSRNAALGLRESGTSISDIAGAVGNRLLFPLYQDRMNRLSSLAGGGQSSSNLASLLSASAGNAGALSTNAGAINAGLTQMGADTRASGVLGAAGAQANTINQLSGIIGDVIGGQPTTTGYSPGAYIPPSDGMGPYIG